MKTFADHARTRRPASFFRRSASFTLRWLLLLTILAVVAAACAEAGSGAARPDSRESSQSSTASSDPVPSATLAPGETPWPTVTPTPDFGSDEELKNARFSTSGWQTDFSKRSIPLSEIFSGGPGKDGIPAIDEPAFEDIAAGDRWLGEQEQVHVVDVGGEVRALPPDSPPGRAFCDLNVALSGEPHGQRRFTLPWTPIACVFVL